MHGVAVKGKGLLHVTIATIKTARRQTSSYIGRERLAEREPGTH